MNHDSLSFALAPCQANDGDARITASIVPAEQRMDFLPKHFGARAMMKFEMSVYDWMGNLCPSYRGGYWNYVELSNGGAFMYPAGVDAFEVTVEGNGFHGTVSAEVAGIIAVSVRRTRLDDGGRDQAVALAGCQRCGSNSAIRLAGSVGRRSSTFLR